MRARSFKPRKVNVVTLGCAKSICDIEVLMTKYDSPDVDKEVRLQHDGHLRKGYFLTAKITGASSFDLDAKLA